ncbi:MAG: DUF6660 family protein [Bacteroidota bacterium]
MKVCGYILAFCIILLAAVPCCSFDDCPDDKTEQTTSHENGDNECGTCSPFFSCEGCAAATIACEPAPFTLDPLRQKPVYTTYLQSSLPQVDYDFWQPPKLG